MKSFYKGELKQFGEGFECYVLEDGRRVFSTMGAGHALGLKSKGGNIFHRTINSKGLRSELGINLMKKLNNPIVFRYLTPDHKKKKIGQKIHGFEASTIVDVLKAIIRADEKGLLPSSQAIIVQQARSVIFALAGVGIESLIDEATGYQDVRAKDALAKILEKYLEKEYHVWTKTFPIEFYQEIARLKGWNFLDFQNNKIRTPGVVGHYTNDFIYNRLAPGVLEELKKRNPILPKGRRISKHHQWFNPEYGHPKLKEHLAAVIALMRASADWRSFERNINRAFPKLNETIPLDLSEI